MFPHTVNSCKLCVNCHDICNMAPATCISVNYVKHLLNFIRSNVHKTVFKYKTVQLFCSDVVVQNVNVISSPACKVLCFKKHRVLPIKRFYVRNIPLCSYTINKITVIITIIATITTVTSPQLSSPLSSLSSSPSISTSSSVSFYISSTSNVCVKVKTNTIYVYFTKQKRFGYSPSSVLLNYILFDFTLPYIVFVFIFA